jgi:two-component system, LytTR family, sensor kinase
MSVHKLKEVRGLSPGIKAWLWRWRWPLMVLGVGAYSLLTAAQHYTAMVNKKVPVGDNSDFGMFVRAALTMWYGWALLAPAIWIVATRWGFRRLSWPSALGLHLLLAPIFTIAQLAVHVLIDIPVEWMLHQPFDPIAHFREIFPGYYVRDVVTYWVIVGLVHGIEFYRATRRQQLRASQLEMRLAEARLQVLKAQLQPHFLFNTLHAISALMHRDVDEADRMVARLSQLLRMSLDTAGLQEVSLRQELELLKPYLEIESARFGERLRIALDIDPAALDAQVPSLVLQPLVENAIRHGVAPRAAPGRIEVRATQQEGALTLTVKDDGPGLKGAAPEDIRRGVGLSNTEARLFELYGARQKLRLADATGGGFEVTVTLPFRREESRAQDSNSHRR